MTRKMSCLAQRPVINCILFMILIAATSMADPVKIQPFSFSPEVRVGKAASVTCLPESGNGPWTFRWTKDGLDIGKFRDVQIESGKRASVLVIEDTRATSAGNYSCTLQGPTGSDHYSAVLSVPDAPRIVEQTKDVFQVSGSSVLMECKVSGSPQPKIRWRKLTGEEGANLPLLQSLKNGSLILDKVDPSDAGIYECAADNGIPPLAKSLITLRVHGMLWRDSLSSTDLVVYF